MIKRKSNEKISEKLKNNNKKKENISKKEIINDKPKEKKMLKTLKMVAIVAISVIAIELIIMLIMYFNNEKKINYLDTINNISLIDNEYYLAAGSSNFRNSKYNKKKVYKYYNDEVKAGFEKIVAEQAKLVKYDSNMKVVWEKTFDAKYDSTFYDAIKVEDGIVAVGSYIYDYSQIELRTRDGLIVKYDDNGKVQWFKNHQILGDTEFYKVIDVNDGIIAVGQSIYENMEIGNHDNGGGIIVKFDYDGNVVWENNFGGNKSGSFNDIVVVNDGYIVCGKDGANYGLIAKFSKTGEIKWHYSTLDVAITDNLGFNAIELYDNKLYIASSINYSDEKDEKGNPIYQFKGCIFVYNLNGKCIKKYRSSNTDSFSDLIVSSNGITAIGYTTVSNEEKNYANQTGGIVKFDLEGKEIVSDNWGGANFDVLTSIIDNNDNYLVVGYSNSFGNKKDFVSKYFEVSKNNEFVFETNK